MWAYILRRLLLMIPTMFGITVVSFIVMAMAPGDPMLSSLGANQATGESSQTRESYLIQKRDLKLDLPLVWNTEYFKDYGDELRHVAHYFSLSLAEIEAELTRIGDGGGSDEDARRIDFLRDEVEVADLDKRLTGKGLDPKTWDEEKVGLRRSLARAVDGFLQVYCEDRGRHGVRPLIEFLRSPDELDRLKVGAIRALGHMVVEAHRYTYSIEPLPEETRLVEATWRTWWERSKDRYPELDPDRRESLDANLKQMVDAPSRKELFRLITDEFFFSEEDAPFFAERFFADDATLRQKSICAVLLNLYIGKLEMTISRDDDAGSVAPERIARVAENWVAHYEARRDEYEVSFLGKLGAVFVETQYAHLVKRLVTFDFGRSALKTREPVSGKIWEAAKQSAPLMLLAQALIYLLAVPLGVLCAVKHAEIVDRLVSFGLFVLYSIPPFVAGMMFLLFFCYGDYLEWFPMEQLHSEGADRLSWFPWLLDYLWHAALPVICLSLFSLAGLAMYSRTAMLDVLGQDYIRTARAKGVAGPIVIVKHALRNALIPIVTLFSNFLPAMLGGSVLIEVIFNIPGMGRLGWESIEQKDYPTLMALIYINAIVVMVSILLTDLLYLVIDPRISFEGEGKKA